MFLVRLTDRVAKLLMILAAGWAFVLAFIILADIIGRSLLNAPLQGVREIVANSIVMIVFLQAGFAIRSRSMLRADFLVNRFAPVPKRAALAFSYLMGIAFFLIIFAGGWDLAISSFLSGEYEGEGALRVPSWPTRFMILVGSALSALSYLVLMILDVFAPDAVGDRLLGQDNERAGTRHV